VRSYRSAGEMWREWGRSIDLKDATRPWQQWANIVFLTLVQALPLVVLIVLATTAGSAPLDRERSLLALVNGALLAIRVMLLWPLSGSYERTGVTFWCSWLADAPAVARVVLSTMQRGRRWRGRNYQEGFTSQAAGVVDGGAV